jgi:hypothetical protein
LGKLEQVFKKWNRNTGDLDQYKHYFLMDALHEEFADGIEDLALVQICKISEITNYIHA